MPDALDTRAALRELVGVLADAVKPACDRIEALKRRNALLAIRDRLDAPAPPPPARTVTRAQYERALAVLLAYQTTRPAKLDQILTALDLRVADDDAEAT